MAIAGEGEDHTLEEISPAYRSNDQLPTPDQSVPLLTAKWQPQKNNEPQTQAQAKQQQQSGREPAHRGLKLSQEEELCLLRICREQMTTYNAEEYPKSFWIQISNLFIEESKRTYSWQSCRRRISNYVKRRKNFYETLNYNHFHVNPDMYKDDIVTRELDIWISDCDNKQRLLQRKKEIENERRNAMKHEKERREYEERRMKNVKRVNDWMDTIPLPDISNLSSSSRLLRHPLDEVSASALLEDNANRGYRRHSRSRSRSPRRSIDSPCNINNRYRQRSPLRLPSGYKFVPGSNAKLEIRASQTQNNLSTNSQDNVGINSTSPNQNPTPQHSPQVNGTKRTDDDDQYHKSNNEEEEDDEEEEEEGEVRFEHIALRMRGAIEDSFAAASQTFNSRLDNLAGEYNIRDTAVENCKKSIGNVCDTFVNRFLRKVATVHPEFAPERGRERS